MKIALHLSESKSHHLTLMRHMQVGIEAAGFTCIVAGRKDEVGIPDADMGVVFGIAGTASGLLDYYGTRVGFVDKGYFGRGTFLRFVPGSIHPRGDFRSSDPRPFKRAGDLIVTHHQFGASVLLAGDSGKGAQFFGGRDARESHVEVAQKLIAMKLGPVVYRPKPTWRDARPIDGTTYDDLEKPIDRSIRYARAVVTWASNAAVDAIRWGRPVVALEPSSAVSRWVPRELNEDNLTRTLPLTLRREILYGLARYQWKTTDFANAATWHAIREQHENAQR